MAALSPTGLVSALAQAFDSQHTREMTGADFKLYIEGCAAIALGEMITTHGRKYTDEFCQAAINNKEPFGVSVLSRTNRVNSASDH